jgi:CDP-paratose synthetase
MGNLKTVLLTGATGFLGGHLLKELIKNDYKVVIITRKKSDKSAIAHLQNQYVEYIIESDLNTNIIFNENEIDGIIHLATNYGRNTPFSEVLKSNVIFPLTLLETAIDFNCKYFINTDTFIAKRDSKYNYLNSYSKSKIYFKEILESYADKIAVANMKLEHIFGEGDSNDKFVTSIIRQLINNVPNIDLTEGTQRRDFIYVKDVVSAYLKVIEVHFKLNGYNDFEVGLGKSSSIKDLVIEAKKLSNSSTYLNFGSLPMREGEFSESKADNISLMSLGWSPQFNVIDGLSQTIAFENNRLENAK